MQARARTRRRLSRTLSRSRWTEYRVLLAHALEAGYEVVTLEAFVDDGPTADRVLILRHDVDQAARSALRMLAIEQELGVRATWYFRWRTARPAVVEAVRDAGHEIGLHYETLTRAVLDGGPPADDAAQADLLHASRETLRREIALFSQRFGPSRSIAAHGDTRVPGVRNGDLLADQDPAAFGVAFDANYGLRRHELACWLTDRSVAEGGWKDGIDPIALLDDGASPVLCLTHPNNWTSGLHLWGARIAQAVSRRGDRPPTDVCQAWPQAPHRR